MNRKKLECLLKIGREKFGQYWNKNWVKIHDMYSDFAEQILNGADPRELTSKNLKLRKEYEDIDKIYWFTFGVSGPQIMRDEDVKKFREFLGVLKDACSEREAADIIAMYDGKIRGLRVQALTTWAAILHPNWFTPLWGSIRDKRGVINPCSANIIGVKRIETFDVYFDILSEIKDVARKVGINNMVEIAFYLTKCNELVSKC